MGAKGGRWRRSEVQALLLPKARFTRDQAAAWARAHGYKAAAVESGGEYWRVRQFDPAGRECRTVAFGRGVKAIVCGPKGNPARMQYFTDVKVQAPGQFGGQRRYGTTRGKFSAEFPLFLIGEAWERGLDVEDLADGFGKGLGTQGDWSAIRDSSKAAKDVMLERALNHLFGSAGSNPRSRRNPLLAIANAGGEVMADRVYEIAYRHKADGFDYVHVFKDPDNVELVVLAPRVVLLRGKRRRILEEH